MKILFFSDNFPPESNALTARLYEHAMYWIKVGHEVTVVTCAPNFPEGKLMAGYKNRWRQVEVMDGIRVVRVKTYIAANRGFLKRTFDFLSFMVTGAFFGLFERRPDVVVATSPQFFTAVAGWVVAAFKRRPFVLEIRDLWPDSIVAVGAMRRNVLIRMFERFERFLYRRADAIVAVTRGLRLRMVEKGVDSGKIDLVINGVDLARYTPREPDNTLLAEVGLPGKFVVGYIGTHGLAYALDKVLDSADLLRDRADVAFLFVGGGIKRISLVQRATGMRLTNVRMLSKQPKERMPSMWSVCDVALIPLRKSDFFASTLPAKMFEAVGMGVPLLFCGPRGEAADLINVTGVGVCLPAEEPVALAQMISRLADDHAQMGRLRAAARAAAPRFSRETQAMRMEAVLRNTCKR